MTLSSAAASRHRRSVMYRKYCIIGETIRLLQQEIQKAKCMLMKQAVQRYRPIMTDWNQGKSKYDRKLGEDTGQSWQ